MIEIDITIEAGDWGGETELVRLTNQTLAETLKEIEVSLPKGAEVSVVFADDVTMRGLNRDWREQDRPTNVLSFASNDGVEPSQWSPLLGDIILAHETVVREASEQSKTFKNHLTHLIVHGFLHLLGYDHIDDEEAERMESLERRILLRLGIADPYSDD